MYKLNSIPPLGKNKACRGESSLVLSIVIYSTFPKVEDSGRRSTIERTRHL